MLKVSDLINDLEKGTPETALEDLKNPETSNTQAGQSNLMDAFAQLVYNDPYAQYAGRLYAQQTRIQGGLIDANRIG